jgi:AraC-like DNA-binding protein
MNPLSSELTANLLGLYVTGAGGREQDTSYQVDHLRRRVFNTFAVVYIWKGRGLFESAETGLIDLPEGSLFFLFPGVWHQYGTRKGESWREYWMLFEGFIPEQYCAAGILNPSFPVFDIGVDRTLLSAWRKALRLFRGEDPDAPLKLSGLLFSILARTFSHARIRNRTAEAEQEIVSRIIRTMEECIHLQSFPLERKAGMFHASYSTLRKKFKKFTGYPPATYFDRMKMSRARTRLLLSEDPVKEIAADLGYSDQYHFSRRFKTLVGISPDHFRKQFRQD